MSVRRNICFDRYGRQAGIETAHWLKICSRRSSAGFRRQDEIYDCRGGMQQPRGAGAMSCNDPDVILNG